MNENKCNHEFVIERGPYLTKAIENAYKNIDPKEAEERLKLAILKMAADEVMYGKEEKK